MRPQPFFSSLHSLSIWRSHEIFFQFYLWLFFHCFTWNVHGLRWWKFQCRKKKQKKKLHKYLWLCKAHNEYHVIEHVVLFTKIPVGLFFTILICLLNMHIAKIGGKTCTDYLAIVCCLFFFSSHPRSLTSMNVLNVDTSFANKKFMLHNPLMS